MSAEPAGPAAHDEARDGSYEWDVRSGALTWSPELYRVLGRDPTAGPLPVADLPALVRPADITACARAAAWLMEHGRTVDVTAPVRIRGVIRHLRAVAEPVHDAEGRLIAVRGVVKEVTAPIAAEPTAPGRPAPERLDDPAATRMAARLQAMVVPAQPAPVTLAGLRVEARYLPAARAPRAGGDWFHTAVLGNGRVLLAVGDVAGHGLAAAAAMVNLRASLSAVAADMDDPARLAGELNRVLLASGEDRTATAVLACWDPVSTELTWAQAGHPAPVLRGPGQTAELRRPAGMVLGSDRSARYEAATARLAPGDALLLYTDGLLASPDPGTGGGRSRSRAHRIVRALRDLPTDPAGAALPRLLERVPPASSDDDACVLLAYPVTGGPAPDAAPERTDAPLFSCDFDRDSLPGTRDAVLALGDRCGLTDLALYNFTLAVTEVVTNAVRHGGASGHLSMWRDGDDLLVEVADRGRGIPAPRRSPSGPRPGQVGGWGLWLARQICSSVAIDSGPNGTRVRMRYPLPAAQLRPPHG
jgi:anti-sigma regulatory factor (Ser/Thr protein kinase)